MMINEGIADRIGRMVLGLGLMALVFVGPKTWIGWFGLIPLITGVVGFCPLYRILKITTVRDVT
jgi:membrane protein implicated in regulation of membrane protease activity